MPDHLSQTNAGDPASRLIAAAGPVFAERGFDRAPVREIAKIAGVNVAAINYYYGDKMGLYRAVIADIREKRQREFPAPPLGEAPPDETLRRIIRTLLSRMLACDERGWEAMLMMREMQTPTEALGDMVREYFKPIYVVLCHTIDQLIQPALQTTRVNSDDSTDRPVDTSWRDESLVAQIALGVVGQCLYYRIGRPVLEQLIEPEIRRKHYDPESLCQHITATTLAACGQENIVQTRTRLQQTNQSLHQQK
jgi:AcrR family transcriptional regulator